SDIWPRGRSSRARAENIRTGLQRGSSTASKAEQCPPDSSDNSIANSSPEPELGRRLHHLNFGAWLYFIALIDLFSHRAVGRSMSNIMTRPTIAVWRHGRLKRLAASFRSGSRYLH